MLASRVLQTGHQIYCYFPWLQTVLFASYNLQDTMWRATSKLTTLFKVTSAKEKKYQTKLMWANDKLRRETLEEAKHAAAEAKEQSLYCVEICLWSLTFQILPFILLLKIKFDFLQVSWFASKRNLRYYLLNKFLE